MSFRRLLASRFASLGVLVSLAHAAPPGATPLSPASPPKSVAPHVPAAWKAGAASVVVTPEKNLFMAGYASRKTPADGKVQDLFVKALALEDEQGGRLVIVTMDLIGVPQSMRRDVAARAEKEFKLPPAALSMNASHTHSGPSLRSSPTTEEDLKNPKIKDAYEYTQALKDNIVGVIGKIARQPAARAADVEQGALRFRDEPPPRLLAAAD